MWFFSTFPHSLHRVTKTPGDQLIFWFYRVMTAPTMVFLLYEVLPELTQKERRGTLNLFWMPTPLVPLLPSVDACVEKDRQKNNLTHSEISFCLWESGFINKFLRLCLHLHHQCRHNPVKSGGSVKISIVMPPKCIIRSFLMSSASSRWFLLTASKRIMLIYIIYRLYIVPLIVTPIKFHLIHKCLLILTLNLSSIHLQTQIFIETPVYWLY